MLDLDSLALKRAKSANEQVESWKSAVWSPAFQKISASMSDGEIMTLMDLCPSVAHLKSVTKYLEEQAAVKGVPPFTLLEQEAQHAGLKPGEWVARQAGSAS